MTMNNDNAPNIIGRPGSRPNERLDRASTRLLWTAREGFWGSNEGSVEVSLFESEDDEDRGGVVLRFEADTDEDFIPFAKLTPRGVELHLAGQWEAEAYLHALAEILQKRPPKLNMAELIANGDADLSSRLSTVQQIIAKHDGRVVALYEKRIDVEALTQDAVRAIFAEFDARPILPEGWEVRGHTKKEPS